MKLDWMVALLVVLGLGLSPMAQAKTKGIELSLEQQQAIEDVNTYFNGFRTLKGEFTQLGNTGNVSTGVLLISKPGKMRFEYAPPNPFVVVSDGRWVAVLNRTKKVADQYPLVTTPLRLLLADKMDLLKNAVIKAADMQDGLITLRLEDKDQMVSGELVLIYDSNSNALRQWIVIDGDKRRTTISLDNLVADVPADPKLFVVKTERAVGKPNNN
ncbi:MAG: outer membrane lipoprotein carrier protein LolA [Aestuariivirgaceae bacterium]|nr:outer membrane lipoprotein carrier protein LolA [Aestuariivirgaceae bacterium]